MLVLGPILHSANLETRELVTSVFHDMAWSSVSERGKLITYKSCAALVCLMQPPLHYAFAWQNFRLHALLHQFSWSSNLYSVWWYVLICHDMSWYHLRNINHLESSRVRVKMSYVYITTYTLEPFPRKLATSHAKESEPTLWGECLTRTHMSKECIEIETLSFGYLLKWILSMD